MASSFGSNATCIALRGSLAEMDKTIWDLGMKIDKYRKLTEEYMKDPFYIEQKTKFNRREVLYYLLLKDTKKMCGVDTPSLLFFYKKKEACPDCDAMSFVLTDLKLDADELSIFSFDSDLNSSSIETLSKIYNITSYPCVVIEEKSYCGFSDKADMIKNICSEKNFSLCGAN
jgi:hypothetical protein